MAGRRGSVWFGVAALAVLAVALVARLVLQPVVDDPVIPDPSAYDRQHLIAALAEDGLALGDAALVRIFKREARLEVWMRPAGGSQYQMFRAYPICYFSGELGPKLKEGDRQSPEGFYRVAWSQLNPNSRHHLAFNLAFPNAFDRQLERTGSALMVHGGCSSIGCYAMTDPLVDEIYAVVEAALLAGQQAVDVHAFPFELTEASLASQANSPWQSFWANLKAGDELFRQSRVPPAVGACNGQYRFGADADSAGCEPIQGWG